MNCLKGFDVGDNGFQAPAEDGSSVLIAVSESSDRLQLLAPFEPWDGKILLVLNYLSRHLVNVQRIIFLWLDHGCVSADI
jgi:hypothetical protein